MRRISKVGETAFDQLYYQGVLETLEKYGIANWNISCVWLSEEDMIKSNQDLLSHNYATDIITIPYEITDDFIHAEILLCSNVIKENAALNNTSFESEIIRVGAHGILHLVGYNDKTETDIKEMREKENEIIEQVSRGTKG